MTGPAEARPPSELSRRVVSALALAAAALGSAWIGGWALALVWYGAAVAVASEWLAMTRVVPRAPTVLAAALGLAAVQVALVLQPGGTVLLVGLAGCAVMAGAASGSTGRLWAVAGFAYAGTVATVPVLLREGGVLPLVWLFAVVWATDVVAYFTGRALGGPRLWPAVSPKKTWSGFAGGVAGAVAAGLAVAWIGGAGSLVAVAALSCVASMVSQGGDLAESAMKRRFGVKDSGSLIPGHGGFMDRLDGFAAVCALLLLGFLLRTHLPVRTMVLP